MQTLGIIVILRRMRQSVMSSPRRVIIACDFSGDVLEGVDRGENIGKDAYTLRRMRGRL